MNEERGFILQKINALKDLYYGFNKNTMRWKEVYHKNIHISDVDIETLPAKEFVEVFEKIIRRHYTQM